MGFVYSRNLRLTNSTSPAAVIEETKPGMVSTIRRKSCSVSLRSLDKFISLNRPQIYSKQRKTAVQTVRGEERNGPGLRLLPLGRLHFLVQRLLLGVLKQGLGKPSVPLSFEQLPR